MNFPALLPLAPLRADSAATLSPNLAHLRRCDGAAALAPGCFAVERCIGAGAMGAVLLARPAASTERVAMKVALPRDGLEEGRRFLDEATITQSLRHPHIIPVHDIGVNEHDQIFYTMPVVEGGTLRTALEGLRARQPEALARFRFRALLAIFLKVCEALAYAHYRGVLHLDLKPENVLLGRFGEVFVADWGLARVVRRDGEGGGESLPQAAPTLRAVRAGTPAYMSPEQAGDGGEVDVRSDVFALGAILYQLITLDRPFPGRDPSSVRAHIRAGAAIPPARRLRTLRAAGGGHLPADILPEQLAEVAMKALSPAPEARPQTVAELQREVESCF